MPVKTHLPGLARRVTTNSTRLPSVPGTKVADLAPLVKETPVLHAPNINTGKQSYASLAVAERLESRAARVQRPLVEQHNAVIRDIMNERKYRVNNDLGRVIRVTCGAMFFDIDPGVTIQPRAVAIAFEERKNAILRDQLIRRAGLDGVVKRPEVEAMQADLQYQASQDIGV